MSRVKSYFEDQLELDNPNEPSYLDSLMTTGFDVDVDENGPFITTADENEEDLEKAMNDRFDFDKYCEDNPDFNAALNGHWEHI